MPEAHQPEFSFPTKINEPFHPALTRLESGDALPPGVRLTQAAKRLYYRFLRQHLAATSKGRDSFRVKVCNLARDLELTQRTIYRCLDQLRGANLVQSVRTGRGWRFRRHNSQSWRFLEEGAGAMSKVAAQTGPSNVRKKG